MPVSYGKALVDRSTKCGNYFHVVRSRAVERLSGIQCRDVHCSGYERADSGSNQVGLGSGGAVSYRLVYISRSELNGPQEVRAKFPVTSTLG